MDKYGEARARLLDDRMKVIQAENLRLQKRVEELNGEVKKWQDICTLSDDRAIVCIGNERSLRTSLNEAVKEIEAKAYEENTAFANRIQFMLVLDILRRHGLAEEK